MTVRSVVLVLLSILAAIFLILNWQGIVAPVPVNFIFGQIEAPLGLILLVVLGVLWIVGIAWSLMTQASTLLEIRRAYKEANANKSLANHAELSRTEQMKKTLQEEMNRMQTQLVAELKASTQTSAAAASHNDERLAALEKSIEVLTARFDKPAKEAGIDLNPQAPVEQKKGIFGFLGGSKEPKLEAKSESKVLPPPAPAAAPELSVPASETKDQKTTDQAPAASSNADGGEPKKGLFGKFFH